MLFGVKLANEIYPPWKASYLDYNGLKKALKEDSVDPSDWNDKDESNFVQLLDSSLENVYGFQIKTYNALIERVSHMEKQTSSEEDIKNLNVVSFQQILEELLSESRELESFSRLNFTGFVKIVKKHDKLHPKYPSVRALLEVRLKELPFHSEEYSPLLYRISFLYNILRSNFNTVSKSLASTSKLSNLTPSDSFTPADQQFLNTGSKSFKFWIHTDNLMEVKTRILRHLPVIIYATAPTEANNLINSLVDQPSDNLDPDHMDHFTASSDSGTENTDLQRDKFTKSYYDPVITTLYLDNDYFELYNNKLLKQNSAPTLRLRWTGNLIDKPDIFMEKRTLVDLDQDNGITDFEVSRVQLKQKFINGFIFNNDPTYQSQTLKKLKERGTSMAQLSQMKSDYEDIQDFITKDHLKPILRTTYTRTAFQIPGDDRIRITIDSNIVYIREDDIDKERPIRDPANWHRKDIDSNFANPLQVLRSGEYVKFPYSVMEIKIKGPCNIDQSLPSTNVISATKLPKGHAQWISDLTTSHLLKEIPGFSIYIQGVASLFSDNEQLDILPFWLPELEEDIRKDPKQAYEDEKKNKKKQKEMQKKIEGMRRLSRINDNIKPIVDKILASSSSPTPSSPLVSSSSPLQQNRTSTLSNDITNETGGGLEDDESSEDENASSQQIKRRRNRKPKSKKKKNKTNILSILTGRDTSLTEDEREETPLPPGVQKPSTYLKNAGPVKVEAKVWLANERTFNKWLSVTTLLSVLTFSIYNSAKGANWPLLADCLAYSYFALTLFCGVWAYSLYMKRLRIIKERSGEALDAPLGPIVVAVVIAVTLIVNFFAAFRNVGRRQQIRIDEIGNLNSVNSELSGSLKWVQELVFRLVGV